MRQNFKIFFLKKADQELASSGDEPLLDGSQSRQHVTLVQLRHLGRLGLGVLLKVGLDGHPDHVLDGVHDFVHLGAFHVVPPLQTKLCCKEPEDCHKISGNFGRNLVMAMDWAITSPSHSRRGHCP